MKHPADLAEPPQGGFGLPSDHGGKDLGIFLPMANGGWILSTTAPKLDGSYEYNRKVALLAEDTGFDFIMVDGQMAGLWRHHPTLAQRA